MHLAVHQAAVAYFAQPSSVDRQVFAVGLGRVLGYSSHSISKYLSQVIIVESSTHTERLNCCDKLSPSNYFLTL